MQNLKNCGRRSHTEEKIQNRPAGTKVFRLDTGNNGEDDVLLGENREDVLRDVLSHHEIKELPEHWELSEVREVTCSELICSDCGTSMPWSDEAAGFQCITCGRLHGQDPYSWDEDE